MIMRGMNLRGRAQNSAKTLFFSKVFDNSVRILYSRVVIDCPVVSEAVGMTYRKGETEFDVLKEVFVWISTNYFLPSSHIQI